MVLAGAQGRARCTTGLPLLFDGLCCHSRYMHASRGRRVLLLGSPPACPRASRAPIWATRGAGRCSDRAQATPQSTSRLPPASQTSKHGLRGGRDHSALLCGRPAPLHLQQPAQRPGGAGAARFRQSPAARRRRRRRAAGGGQPAACGRRAEQVRARLLLAQCLLPDACWRLLWTLCAGTRSRRPACRLMPPGSRPPRAASLAWAPPCSLARRTSRARTSPSRTCSAATSPPPTCAARAAPPRLPPAACRDAPPCAPPVRRHPPCALTPTLRPTCALAVPRLQLCQLQPGGGLLHEVCAGPRQL